MQTDRKIEYTVRRTIAERLSRLRQEHGLSRESLSKATGIPMSTIRTWELGLRSPPVVGVVTLARHYGVTMDYLLGLE